MTKRDIVVRISDDVGLVQQDVQAVVQRLLDTMAEALARGETIELRNFGIFQVQIRKARVGRNPKVLGSSVRIPSRAVVKFKAGKELKQQVEAMGTGFVESASQPPAPVTSKSE
ncbi:MAG: integration host factor subunit beta [Verrucomicrobiae bacterium]|nr:integration host factor subunit beta [Verrucomicrobiae bacterium]